MGCDKLRCKVFELYICDVRLLMPVKEDILVNESGNRGHTSHRGRPRFPIMPRGLQIA